MEGNSIEAWLGSTIVVSGLISIIVNLITNYKSNKWKYKTDLKLEHFKAEMTQNDKTLSTVLEVQKNNYSYSQEIRVSTMHEIWKSFNEITFEFPEEIIVIYNVLSKDEISTLFKDMDKSAGLIGIESNLLDLDLSNYLSNYSLLRKRLANGRPFIGEDLWLCFNVYNMFLSRIIMHIDKGIKYKVIEHWHVDSVIFEILRQVLSNEEVSKIKEKELASLNYTMGVLEAKILKNMNDIISGNAASKFALEHINTIKSSVNVIDYTKKIS